MRVLLIAGFSNQEIRNHLSLKEKPLAVPFFLKLLRIHPSAMDYHDYAPWISNILLFFEKKKDVDLHVLVHHVGMNSPRQDFDIRGIHYHFFRSEYSSLLRKVGNYRIWRLLQNCGRHTMRVLKEIQPDLVLLSGTENPITSVSILYAKDYPRLCLCQVIYNDPERAKYSRLDKLKSSVEKAIYYELDCFAVYCRKHYDLLNAIVPGKYVFKFNWPPKDKMLEPEMVQKEYDFVNFAANHSAAKGTQDSICALSIVKRVFPGVKLNIVGNCSDGLKRELTSLIKKFELENNVFFTPFFEKREDLFLHVQKSKFAVLPCKLDNTSGTMIQSMLLGLPLVVYKTAGTSAFNEKRLSALVVEMDDVNSLAEHMLSLLENPSLANELRVNGRMYKEEQVTKSAFNWNRLIDSFPFIIDHYKTGAPIPEDRLFSPTLDD